MGRLEDAVIGGHKKKDREIRRWGDKEIG